MISHGNVQVVEDVRTMSYRATYQGRSYRYPKGRLDDWLADSRRQAEPKYPSWARSEQERRVLDAILYAAKIAKIRTKPLEAKPARRSTVSDAAARTTLTRVKTNFDNAAALRRLNYIDRSVDRTLKIRGAVKRGVRNRLASAKAAKSKVDPVFKRLYNGNYTDRGMVLIALQQLDSGNWFDRRYARNVRKELGLCK